jgi:hypothetical protein
MKFELNYSISKKHNLNNQRDKKKIINYSSETLRTYDVMAYEWIDNLCFTIDPGECLDNVDEYLKIAKELFLQEGWEGVGKIELMWIPPFMFDSSRTEEFTVGVTVWHVKQLEDGISWILHPKGIFDKKQTR